MIRISKLYSMGWPLDPVAFLDLLITLMPADELVGPIKDISCVRDGNFRLHMRSFNAYRSLVLWWQGHDQ